jgi:Serine aminopeptidase, S33
MAMKTAAYLLPWAIVSLLLASCPAPSQFIPAPLPGTLPHSLAYPHPEHRVLLIYNHGSRAGYLPDHCVPNGWTTPNVVKALSGQKVGGLDIVVYGLCTNVPATTLWPLIPVGDIKVLKRVRNIERVVRTFLDSGVPPAHLFLVGHSAGGWASLLVARRQQVPMNAVIAFAPAFAGRKARRSAAWQALQAQHVTWLLAAAQLHALVFAFDNDAYNPPEDLLFLQAIPGVRFLRLSEQAIAGIQCQRPNGHSTVFRECFAQTQQEFILAYIAERVAAQEAPDAQDKACCP